LYQTQFLPGKLTFYGRVLKSVAFVALVPSQADEIRITIFKSFGAREITELVRNGDKLTNIFLGLVTSVLGLDLARGPPVGLP
jgi:hypothetical protein